MSETFQVHSLAVARTRRRRPARSPGVSWTIQVDRAVWSEAVRRAGGDPSRLLIESATSVLILNHRNGKLTATRSQTAPRRA